MTIDNIVSTKTLEEYRKPVVTETITNIQQSRYEEQEAKRAKLVQIDQKPVLILWLIGVAVGFLASATISFNGITSVAPLVGLGFDWMAWLFFFIFEFFYLLFLVAYLLLASRSEKTRGTLFGLWFFGGVAVLANGYHTITYHKFDFSSPELWAGVVLSIAAPIAIMSISKLASNVVFAKRITLNG